MQHVTNRGFSARVLGVAVVAATMLSLPLGAVATPGGDETDAASTAAYWTQARMDAAIPRDLVVDEDGQGFLRRPDGTLQPYGPGASAQPAVKPDSPGGGGGGGSDTEGPVVTGRTPANAAVIDASPHPFSATVTDASGVKSVTFLLTGPDGTTSAHAASNLGGDEWGATISLTEGSWSWFVEARDTTRKGGNLTTTDTLVFTVDLPDDGGGQDPGDPDPGTVVTNSEWTHGGAVQTAAGRIYFEMPGRGPFWSGYVCSGTVATDATSNTRSVIITAAHCVYDEVNDVFARNVLFIPDQAGGANGTNTDCSDDPLGCWVPTHGVVDAGWADGSWPDIIPWDHGYYVVPTSGAHAGTPASSESLELAAGSLPVQFAAPVLGAHTHALGYSYSDDPNFMYCAEALGLDDGGYGSLWLASCGLSGGASGGPWVQPMDVGTGRGPIVGVNSYGYGDQPGMGSSHLSTGTAECLFGLAEGTPALTHTGGTVAACG